MLLGNLHPALTRRGETVTTNVLLGISGGIAAYKMAPVVRSLRKAGCNVVVAMTQNATEFVTPLTFETLSGNPVVLDTFKRTLPHAVEHVGLGAMTDILVVAPATANIIAKIAQGIADDILTTTVLSLRAGIPRLIFPSMNERMWHSPIVQANIAQLRSYGYQVIEPASGELASGDVGPGRLPEPDDVADTILSQLAAAES